MNSKNVATTLQKRKSLVVGDLIFRSCNDHQLIQSDLDEARQKLGETEEKKEICLQRLKGKLSKDKEFYYRSDDVYLIRFLRYAKYDYEKAYRTIRNFYSLRKDFHELRGLPSNLDSLLNNGVEFCLPYRTEDGNIIHFMDTNNWRIPQCSILDLLKSFMAFADIMTLNPSCQVNGIIFLWDFKGITAQHVSQIIRLSNLKIISRILQDIYPMKVKRVIGIHCNRLIRGVFNSFSFVLKRKTADRVVLLGSDFSELHQYLNPNILLKEYGGNIERSECSITRVVLDNLSYLTYERSFGPVLES